MNEVAPVAAGDSVVVVVADSGDDAGLALGATVSVFCSHATSAMEAAKMQK